MALSVDIYRQTDLRIPSPHPPPPQPLSSFSVHSQNLSFPCFAFLSHLNWSVEYFVSLLNNHFKRVHPPPPPQTHSLLSALMMLQFAVVQEREREFLLMRPNYFPSMPATFSCSSLDWVYKWSELTRFGTQFSSSFFSSSYFPCVVYLQNLQDKPLTVTLPDDTLYYTK